MEWNPGDWIAVMNQWYIAYACVYTSLIRDHRTSPSASMLHLFLCLLWILSQFHFLSWYLVLCHHAWVFRPFRVLLVCLAPFQQRQVWSSWVCAVLGSVHS